jgi:hypothetical protein
MLLIAVTVAAASMGGQIAIMQTSGLPRITDRTNPHIFSALVLLTIEYVVWTVTAVWVFENRRSLTSFELVIVAAMIKIIGSLAFTAYYVVIYTSSLSEASMLWLGIGESTCTTALDITTWLLIVIAFVRANARTHSAATAP